MWAGGWGVVEIRWVFSCSLRVCVCVCVCVGVCMCLCVWGVGCGVFSSVIWCYVIVIVRWSLYHSIPVFPVYPVYCHATLIRVKDAKQKWRLTHTNIKHTIELIFY